jgi:ankyrin repeat protein
MIRTKYSILAATAIAVAGFVATVEAQEKPEEKPPTDIWQAAEKGDIEAINGFLAKDNKIDDQNKDGYSILHVAIRRDQAAVAEFALANGADINLRSNSKKTPLHYTAQYNQLALAKLLVAAKADLAAKDKKGRTALDLATGEAKREMAQYLRDAGVMSKNDEAAAKSVFVAAKIGSIDAIKKHLEAGVDVNGKDKSGYSALHLAAKAGQVNAMEVLIDAKADIQGISKSEKSALHYAAQKGHKASVALLLDKGAAVNARDKKGKTPLDLAGKDEEIAALLRGKGGKTTKELLAADDIFAAAEVGDVESIKKLLAGGADVNAKDKGGYTALHLAAKRGQAAAAAALLEAKADIGLVSKSGKTALHYVAYYNGNLDLAKLLLDAGAAVNAKDGKNKTPLDYALSKKRTELTELLRSKGGKTTKELAAAENIFAAADVGDLEAIKKHLEGGEDVNAANKQGYTALHMAVRRGQKDAAALLLEKGANVNAERKGKTTLDFAGKNEEIAALLREKGGKTGKEIKAAGSIFSAAQSGLVDAVKTHLAGGADVNAKNKGGYTALHLAAKKGHVEVAKVLLEAKADIGLVSKSGKTALHYVAYYNGNLDLAAALLDAGAAVNAKDGKNKTPLDYALSKKRTELTELLRSKGGKTTKELAAAENIFAAADVGDLEAIKKHLEGGEDVNAANKQGYTALHMAVRRGQKDAAALLLEKGANVNAERKGKTTLDFAGKNEEIAALLREKGGKTGKEIKAAGSIFSAAQNGLVDAVKTHLAAGVEVNGKNKGGYAALHLAAKKGHVEVAKALLDAKADIGLASKSGKTALHYVAYYNGNLDLAKLLLDAGADPNVLDKRSKTPLDYAVSRKNDALVELLLAKGARTGKELRAENDVHYAAANGYADAVRGYIENGGDVNAGDRGGYTALQYAAYNGYIEVVRVLVENKADVNAAANKPKKSALHYAAQQGRKEIALLLLDKGADVNALDSHGRTALDITLRYRRTETGELLRQRGGKLGSELAKPDGGNADPQPLIVDDELDGLTGDGVVLTLVLGSEGPGLSVLGWPGEIYLIESSSDLSGWIGVDEVTNDAGRIEWSDPRGDLGAAQFYRIRILD